jgi:hypothetical protein
MDPGSRGSPPENLRFSGLPTVRDDRGADDVSTT